ncbi:hypothetical protein LIA77_06247 [Sarocladium implicatum]|nr:hypothetical protein LIA77_06247 [Sarocladium implicatum]
MSSTQVLVEFTYPPAAASDFDMDYYVNTHCDLLDKHWRGHGLRQVTLVKAEEGEDFFLKAQLLWDSLDAWKNAPNVDQVVGDVPNFTKHKPAARVGKIQNTFTY